MWYLVLVVIVLVLLIAFWPVALVVASAYLLYRIIRVVRKNRYFSSERFLRHRQEVAAVIAEHNEISSYASEIRRTGVFRIGVSATGSQAHLATFENTSRHQYRRDRNVATYEAENVHNCSLQVVRNAAADPIKYLVKYFNIKADETTLAQVESLGESFSRLEEAVANLKWRELSITQSFSPPPFILKHYAGEFNSQIGMELSAIEVPYPIYLFEYVSAGGNSSQRTTVKMDTPTIDALVEALSQKIRFSKSVAGQRALMTAKLRDFIKTRDGHRCRYCQVTLAAEPHLLLEVDHIVPLSKGGLSTIENLQTLCWRCNRSKSNKLVDA